MKPRRDSLESSIHFYTGRSSSTFMEMSKPKKHGDGGILEKGAGGESKKKWKRSKQSVEHVLFTTGLIFVVGGICYRIWWQIWQGAQHI